MDPADSSNLRERCRAVSLALSGHAVFTHLTAAALRGWQLPDGVEIPVIAVTDDNAPHHDRRGVFVRRCAIPAEHRTVFNGVAVASAGWTIAELAEDLSFLDLVAVIDSALHLKQCTIEAIWNWWSRVVAAFEHSAEPWPTPMAEANRGGKPCSGYCTS